MKSFKDFLNESKDSVTFQEYDFSDPNMVTSRINFTITDFDKMEKIQSDLKKVDKYATVMNDKYGPSYSLWIEFPVSKYEKLEPKIIKIAKKHKVKIQ